MVGGVIYFCRHQTWHGIRHGIRHGIICFSSKKSSFYLSKIVWNTGEGWFRIVNAPFLVFSLFQDRYQRSIISQVIESLGTSLGKVCQQIQNPACNYGAVQNDVIIFRGLLKTHPFPLVIRNSINFYFQVQHNLQIYLNFEKREYIAIFAFVSYCQVMTLFMNSPCPMDFDHLWNKANIRHLDLDRLSFLKDISLFV